ncbi:MAG TPA: hypothetical protein DEB39_03460 [Planctomycetaceae bacterium]|nr:hypothetical protein [Planctomycetaceae bacterium]
MHCQGPALDGILIFLLFRPFTLPPKNREEKPEACAVRHGVIAPSGEGSPTKHHAARFPKR